MQAMSAEQIAGAREEMLAQMAQMDAGNRQLVECVYAGLKSERNSQ